jgi:hypothetical protein
MCHRRIWRIHARDYPEMTLAPVQGRKSGIKRERELSWLVSAADPSTDGPLMHFIVLSMTMSQFRVGSYEFGVEQ